MTQFASPAQKMRLPFYEVANLADQDTMPHLPAWAKMPKLIRRKRSVLECIGIFFIALGLFFLIAVMIVLFWKLFIVVIHVGA